MSDPTALPALGREHPLRGRVIDALLDQGLLPSIDADDDVAVTLSGQRMFLRCVDTLPPLVRVFGQWRIDGESMAADELVRLRAANAVTSALNLVKATVHGDRLVVAVDLVVSDDLDLQPLIFATLNAVLGSVQTWHRTVAEMIAGGGDG